MAKRGDTVLGGTPSLTSVFLYDITRDRDGAAIYEASYWPAPSTNQPA